MCGANKDSVTLLTGNTRIHNFYKDWVTLLSGTVTQMAQTPMLRAEVYARALRASQNAKRAEVWVGARQSGGQQNQKNMSDGEANAKYDLSDYTQTCN